MIKTNEKLKNENLSSESFDELLSPQKIKESLRPDHLIYQLICEHEVIIKLITEIENSLEKIKTIEEYQNAREEIKTLISYTNHLIGAEAHNQKEEIVLFPELAKRTENEILLNVKNEHDNIRKYQNEFKFLLLHTNPVTYPTFKSQFIISGELYCNLIKNEIDKENYFLYPLCLKLIIEEEVWQNMKRECSLIGCCSFIIPRIEKKSNLDK